METANFQWIDKTLPKFTNRKAAHAHARMLGWGYTVVSPRMNIYAYNFEPDRDYMNWLTQYDRKLIGQYIGRKQIAWRKSLLGPN